MRGRTRKTTYGEGFVALETVNRLETGNGMESEKCLSPVCGNPVNQHPRAVWKKKLCSAKCKMDMWALRRVVKLLKPLGVIRASNLLIDLWESGGAESSHETQAEIAKHR